MQKRQSVAEKVKEQEDDRSMRKWPYILVGYFFVTLIILYILQTVWVKQMKNFYLKLSVEQSEAVKAIKVYQSNLIIKW